MSALRLRAEKAETELAKVQAQKLNSFSMMVAAVLNAIMQHEVAESELRQRVAELIEGRQGMFYMAQHLTGTEPILALNLNPHSLDLSATQGCGREKEAVTVGASPL